MFVLESEAHARARDARCLAEVVGFASTADAGSLVAPRADGASAARAITLALEDAGLVGTDVDVSAHGTSTPLNDEVETAAIKRALGDHAYRVPVSSLKSMTGHALGASGAIEAVACVKTIETGVVHPTINLEHPDPKCDFDVRCRRRAQGPGGGGAQPAAMRSAVRTPASCCDERQGKARRTNETDVGANGPGAARIRLPGPLAERVLRRSAVGRALEVLRVCAAGRLRGDWPIRSSCGRRVPARHTARSAAQISSRSGRATGRARDWTSCAPRASSLAM